MSSATQSEWFFHWAIGLSSICTSDFLQKWRDIADKDIDGNVFARPEVVLAREQARQSKDIPTQIPLVAIASHSRRGKIVVALELERMPQRRNYWCSTLRGYAESGFDYCTPLVVDCEHEQVNWMGFWNALVQSLKSRGVRFDRVRISQLERNVVPDQQQAAGFTVVLSLAEYPHSEALLAVRSRKTRYNLQRSRRLLEREHGPLQLQVFRRETHLEATEEIKRFVASHVAYWEARGHVLSDTYEIRFFTSVLANCDHAHFSVLKSGDTPISWAFGLVQGDRYLYYVPAITVAFSRYSPGTLHFLALVDHLAALGVREFDFLRGGETYKYQWPVWERSQYAFECYMPTWRGFLGQLVQIGSKVRRTLRTWKGS